MDEKRKSDFIDKLVESLQKTDRKEPYMTNGLKRAKDAIEKFAQGKFTGFI